MKSDRDDIEQEALRQRAEAIVGDDGVHDSDLAAQDPDRVLHELRVHQVELEMQNDELRRVQLQLEESAARYRALFEEAPMGYLTLDRSGTIEEANLASSELLGVALEDLVRRPLASFMQEYDADALHCHLQDVFSSDGRRNCELMLAVGSAEGARRQVPVHLSTAVVKDTGRCRSVIIDLTELREEEEGRAASEARTRSLLETAGDAIVTSDERGRIESFNQAAERLFGYSEREVLGQSVSMLAPTRYREAHDHQMERYVATGEARIIGQANRELVGLKKDGTTFPLELGLGEWWDHGERKFTAIIHDFTARMEAEDELRRSEGRFRQIADHLHDVLAVMDRDTHRISYASRAFQTIWGRPLSELYARTSQWPDWVHPDDKDRVDDAHASYLSGDPFDEEHRILRPDGEVRWVRTRVYAMDRDANGVAQDVAIMQDVTNERRLEEKLREAQKMEAVAALASGVAHDFNNLLMGILGCTDLALRKTEADSPARMYLEESRRAIKRGASLTQQLLRFSRGHEEGTATDVELDAVVASTNSMVRSMLGEAVALDLKLNVRKWRLRGEVGKLEQVLLNLVVNARDAMPNGGRLVIETAEVTLDREAASELAMPPGDFVTVSVRDTGAGMDAATKARIFEPFFTTKSIGHGTGLGLASVYGIVQEFEGHISVQSAPGAGTSFTLYFPRSHSTLTAEHERVAVATPRRGAETILVVEDEPLVRLTIRGFLEPFGYRVLDACDLPEATLIAGQNPDLIDLVITDVMLPGSTGRRVAEELGAGTDLPVIFISAHPEGALQEADRLPPDAVLLEKPFGAGALMAQVQRALGDARSPDSSSAAEATPEPAEATPEPAAAAPEPAAAAARLLLVDDHEAARSATAMLLQDSGYDVLSAKDGAEALALCEQHGGAIDALLTDVGLPDIEGTTLATSLRTMIPGLPVIFISGKSVDNQELLEAPRTQFLMKPVDIDELIVGLEDLLASG